MTSQWYPPRSYLTESEAARLHIGLIGSLNARLPRHTPIACDGYITLGLWLSVSIRSRLSSLTSHLRYVKPEMLSLGFRVIAHTDVSSEMFQMTRPKLPYSRGYRFDDFPSYIWYIFLSAMEFDTNFSQCDYCGHFFKPKTKKKTRYCDRVRTDDGRTCKQIGPPLIYKFRIQYSDLLADYDRAMNRNYRRVERYELKLGDEKHGKDPSYNDYADWLRELHLAKISFMSGELSEEEFKKTIHLLD